MSDSSSTRVACDRCFRRFSPRGLGSHRRSHERADFARAVEVGRSAAIAVRRYTDIDDLRLAVAYQVRGLEVHGDGPTFRAEAAAHALEELRRTPVHAVVREALVAAGVEALV